MVYEHEIKQHLKQNVTKYFGAESCYTNSIRESYTDYWGMDTQKHYVADVSFRVLGQKMRKNFFIAYIPGKDILSDFNWED